MLKRVLTIAGSDSGGGAGIQADLKTFSALGTFGMSVITAITAQNTKAVTAVEDVSVGMVAAQLDAVFDDLFPDAVKIGMVSNIEIIRTIADKLDEYKMTTVVVDPVMVSKSGCNLMRPDARNVLIDKLVSRALVLTPNVPEAEVLTGMKITTPADMQAAAEKLYKHGAKNVVIKGGHRLDIGGKSIDVLFAGRQSIELIDTRYDTTNTHGTGCTFSSAIAALLARGLSVVDAVKGAKQFISRAIENSLTIGQGCGPTHHFWRYYDRDNGRPVAPVNFDWEK